MSWGPVATKPKASGFVVSQLAWPAVGGVQFYSRQQIFCRGLSRETVHLLQWPLPKITCYAGRACCLGVVTLNSELWGFADPCHSRSSQGLDLSISRQPHEGMLAAHRGILQDSLMCLWPWTWMRDTWGRQPGRCAPQNVSGTPILVRAVFVLLSAVLDSVIHFC